MDNELKEYLSSFYASNPVLTPENLFYSVPEDDQGQLVALCIEGLATHQTAVIGLNIMNDKWDDFKFNVLRKGLVWAFDINMMPCQLMLRFIMQAYSFGDWTRDQEAAKLFEDDLTDDENNEEIGRDYDGGRI